MPEENINIDAKPDQTDEQPYLGTWQDREAAEIGLENMQSVMDSQGNELGTLRKQGEVSQQVIQDLQNQITVGNQSETKERNFDKELSTVKAEMARLDQVDENYHRDLTALMDQSTSIASDKVMAKAAIAFKQELDKREIKAVHNAFYKDNPEFNTPEMQARIREYIAKDSTGMSDQLVAFREIQRDDAMGNAKQLADENVELKRIANLSKGADSTGKVVTKGQAPPQAKSPKTTGSERDKGMQGALDALRA